MASLGVSSAEWNGLETEEIYELIYEKIGDGEEPGDAGEIVTQEPQQERSELTSQPENRLPEETTVRTTSARKAVSISKRVDESNAARVETKSRGRMNLLVPGIVFALILSAGVIIALVMQYRTNGTLIDTVAPADDTVMSPAQAMDVLDAAGEEYPVYEFTNCLYYDSISDAEKELYQVYYDLIEHKDDKEYSRKMTMSRDGYAKLKDNLDLVFEALLSDHPELFYISLSPTRVPSIKEITDSDTAVIEITLGPASADRDENEMIAKFDSAVNNFMREIDTTKPEAQIEMQIHDKLNEMVSYDMELLLSGLAGPDLAHTAYGALVDNGRGTRHRAVCDGYAQAYQYLLGKAGICAAQVTGKADKPGGTLWGDAYHAWNVVRIEGEWYEVDCCWDDIEIEEMKDFYLKREIMKIEDKYFYVIHHWFNRTTEQMENLAASERTRFFIPGYESFNFIEETTHIRWIRPEEDWYRVFEYLNRYLPQATGTKYSIDNFPGPSAGDVSGR